MINSFFNYIFDANPGTSFKYYWLMITLTVILIGGGLAFKQFYKKRKKEDIAFKLLFKKIPRDAILMGTLFGALAVFRYEQIPYFAMRFWIYGALALLAYLIYKYTDRYLKEYKKQRESFKARAQAAATKKKKPKYTAAKKKR